MSMTLGPIVPARTGSSEVLPVARSPSSNVFCVILAYASAEARARPMLRERHRTLHGPGTESRRVCARPRSGARGGGRKPAGSATARGAAVLPAELVHAPGGVDDLLLAGV